MDELNATEIFQILKDDGNLEIIPSDGIADIGNRHDFKKLELTQAQKIQFGGLMQHFPAMTATGTLANAYTVTFPNGIPKVLTPLKQGGFGTMVKGESGRFVGSASLYSAETQAAVLNTFNMMSIVSGQYFLSQINSELRTINQSIDKILEFLQEDKKAGLLAEIDFAKYAYKNYISIMEHEQQRIATIASLQGAKKEAMKDMEFYIKELEPDTEESKNNSDINKLIDETTKTKKNLEISMQLYIMSSLLEIYYAQNFDSDYILYVEKEATSYIGKCEKRILSAFSKLHMKVQSFKENPLKKNW